MRIFSRSLLECIPLWRLWLPSAALIALTVPLVIVLPVVQKHLIDDVLLAQRMDLLVPTLAQFVAVWLLIPVLQTVGGVLRANLDERLTIQWRNRLFRQCQTLSVPMWQTDHSGRTLALFSNDAPSVAGFFGSGLLGVLANVLTLVGGAVVMISLSWQLAIVVMVVPPLIGGVAAIAARPLRRASRQVQDKAAEMNERLLESLSGLREIAAFAQELSEGERYQAVQRDLLALRLRLATIGAFMGAGQSVFSLAVTGTLLGVGGYLVITGQTSLGSLLATQQLYGQVFPTAMQFAGIMVGVQKVLASMDRMYDLLDRNPMVPERPDAQPPRDVRGAVSLRDVSFEYVPGRPVLRDVSIDIAAGEVVALVGPSGAGKSTLTSLIARFYDPTRGQVLLDGVDLRDLTLRGLRGLIGVVFQDTYLFATTIRANIAFGHERVTEADIVAAARAANAWEFIEQLPDGLDTYVGQRGAQLSEGQKQRLAIARALVRDPRILILDEPTSALDARSEHLLQGALENLIRGRTTFIIAHRLATVRRADRILVIEGGRVVEQGTHADLLDSRGLYHELHELQFAEANRAAAGPLRAPDGEGSDLEPVLAAPRLVVAANR